MTDEVTCSVAADGEVTLFCGGKSVCFRSTEDRDVEAAIRTLVDAVTDHLPHRALMAYARAAMLGVPS